MGRSVQLLVVTLRPGSERGAGAGMWLGLLEGDSRGRGGWKGLSRTPGSPPWRGQGCEEDGRQGWRCVLS